MKMLIVEDNANHLADAKSLVTRISEAFGLEVRYASTLEEATNLIEWAEVVVSDLFFPQVRGGSPDPVMPRLSGSEELIAFAPQISGVALAAKVLAAGKKVIFCTSTYHHGDKTRPGDFWARTHGVQMVDVDLDDDNPNGEAASKSWDAAVLYAVYLHRGGHVETIDKNGCRSYPPRVDNVARAISFKMMVNDPRIDEILDAYYSLVS
ncbi:MAG: hypothetical protein WC750_04745 [Patescibacteria group bacterium]|jgi:hypothetical protein